MSLWNIDWKEVTIWWLVCILVFGIGYAAGAYDGKHAADRWWQANWDNYVHHEFTPIPCPKAKEKP